MERLPASVGDLIQQSVEPSISVREATQTIEKRIAARHILIAKEQIQPKAMPRIGSSSLAAGQPVAGLTGAAAQETFAAEYGVDRPLTDV